MGTTPKLVPPGTPNDGLPPNWIPIEEPPTVVGAPTSAPPASIPGPGPYFAASIPLVQQLTPDIMPTRYPGGLGAYRIMPPGPSGVASVNSASKSVVVEEISTVVGNSSSPSGSAILVNGISLTGPDANFNSVAPAIPSGDAPVEFAADSGTPKTNVSAYVPVFGSSSGAVPGVAPNTTEFLRADGTWNVPPGTGGAANYQTVQQAGTSKPVEPRLNFLAPFTATDDPGNTSTDIGVQCFAAKGSAFAASGAILTSATSLATIAITFPSTGGPYSVDFRYFLYLHFTAALNSVDFWVSASAADSLGNTVFAGTGTANSNGTSGGNTSANCAWISEGNWAAGTTVTFTLLGEATSGGATVVGAPVAGSGPSSKFQCVAVPSI